MTELLLQRYRGRYQEGDLLTFPEFVRYLGNSTGEVIPGHWDGFEPRENESWAAQPNLNGHWRSYWETCSPCHESTKPTVIAKLDGDFGPEVTLDFLIVINYGSNGCFAHFF